MLARRTKPNSTNIKLNQKPVLKPQKHLKLIRNAPAKNVKTTYHKTCQNPTDPTQKSHSNLPPTNFDIYQITLPKS